MKDFLTTTRTVAPPISILWYAVMIALVLLSIWSSLKYHDNPRFVKAFKWIQIAQLLMLYSWYFGFRIPFSNSLPFYHCRIAMFVMLLIPGTSKYKQYFALLGTFGATAALAYPLFDPYPFPHVTILSFIIGHVALLGNALLYLFRNYQPSLLNLKNVVVITFALNGLIWVVNLVVGGDYGFLNKPPLVGSFGQPLNYLLVSTVIVIAIRLTGKLVENFLQQKSEEFIQEKI